jgi:hypothetical protein
MGTTGRSVGRTGTESRLVIGDRSRASRQARHTDPVGWAYALQCAGHHRRHLRNLCAPPDVPTKSAPHRVQGAVAIFDEDGNFIKELIVGSRLSAPWGITLAPPSFGRFGSHLLVANFSFLHSEINAFDPINGKLRGTLRIDTGTNSPGGLWTIAFGVGGSNGSPDVLYFTDGINGERDGLFGAIAPQRKAPEHECEDCDSQ